MTSLQYIDQRMAEEAYDVEADAAGRDHGVVIWLPPAARPPLDPSGCEARSKTSPRAALPRDPPAEPAPGDARLAQRVADHRHRCGLAGADLSTLVAMLLFGARGRAGCWLASRAVFSATARRSGPCPTEELVPPPSRAPGPRRRWGRSARGSRSWTHPARRGPPGRSAAGCGRPGATAHEVASTLAAEYPALGDRVQASALLFDEVRYAPPATRNRPCRCWPSTRTWWCGDGPAKTLGPLLIGLALVAVGRDRGRARHRHAELDPDRPRQPRPRRRPAPWPGSLDDQGVDIEVARDADAWSRSPWTARPRWSSYPLLPRRPHHRAAPRPDAHARTRGHGRRRTGSSEAFGIRRWRPGSPGRWPPGRLRQPASTTGLTLEVDSATVYRDGDCFDGRGGAARHRA